MKLTTFKEYIELIESSKHVEFDEFLNTITTNLTSFFREDHHFKYLAATIIPDLVKARTKQVRFWSAGCSTGEEPYSISMVLKKHLPKSIDVKILATDLDANVLKHGRQGIYDQSRIEGLDIDILRANFKKNSSTGGAIVNDNLKNLITFNRLNLLGEWPIKSRFDVIFCRNVLIYFDKKTQKSLIDRFVHQLNPKGYLIIGHSENINRFSDELEFIGQTIYRKTH